MAENNVRTVLITGAAGGIGKALITTASGLIVAIPAVFFHRYLLRRVDEAVYAAKHRGRDCVQAALPRD